MPSFPAYLLFASSASAPTSGAEALSGALLPSGAVGLVIRLNRDNARGFAGADGTANISIPIAVAGTLRFGIFKGKYNRPRAEFPFGLRYLTDNQTLMVPSRPTNVMFYGMEGKSGHQNLRMLVPAGGKQLAGELQRYSLPIPQEGDAAFLEWPTPLLPQVRLSLLARGSSHAQAAGRLLTLAQQRGELVGGDACWLPAGLAPAW